MQVTERLQSILPALGVDEVQAYLLEKPGPDPCSVIEGRAPIYSAFAALTTPAEQPVLSGAIEVPPG